MKCGWQGKPKYSETTFPGAILSTTNPTCQTRARTGAGAVGSQRLTAWAMARPSQSLYQLRYPGSYYNNISIRKVYMNDV
jgi:hypothetical protein